MEENEGKGTVIAGLWSWRKGEMGCKGMASREGEETRGRKGKFYGKREITRQREKQEKKDTVKGRQID